MFLFKAPAYAVHPKAGNVGRFILWSILIYFVVKITTDIDGRTTMLNSALSYGILSLAMWIVAVVQKSKFSFFMSFVFAVFLANVLFNDMHTLYITMVLNQLILLIHWCTYTDHGFPF